MDVFLLNVLRTIAQTTARITLNAAIKSGNIWRVHLVLEEDGIDDDTFITACRDGQTEIIR